MKTTRIYARIFNFNGSITLKRKEYLTIQDAVDYISTEMSDTGEVEYIEHLEDGKVIKTIKNKDFRKPFTLETHRAAAFIKA